jgi:APA family basic amino acid/polyamine antiporter
MVIANMIGTGVFTSLGYQVVDLHSVFALLMLWVVGGVLALCGAMTYAELGSRLPSSGGEYQLVRNIYHPLPGFLQGWVSAIAGFAAPTALAAIAFGKYTHSAYPALNEMSLAIALVVVFTLVHSFSVKMGSAFQDTFTIFKVVVIVVFIVLVLAAPATHKIEVLPDAAAWREIFTGSFAVNLIYVSFAYTGWNAAIYVVGEIRDPHKTLPLSLIAGTSLVTVLYALLNLAFLYAVPQQAIAGKVEIGHIVAVSVFGDSAGDLISLTIGLLMISTVSVMVFIGARVIHKMGEDFSSLSFFNRMSSKSVPVTAVWLQGAITLAFIISSTFDQVLVYSAFCLILNTMMAVCGIFVARARKIGQPVFTMKFYPLAPILFLALNSFILIYVFIDKPVESLVGLGIMLAGIPFYYALSRGAAVSGPTTITMPSS